MIVVRRFLTFPLGLILLVLLIVALALLQVNATFLDPDYYTDELRKADIYRFALQDVLTSALDEARALEGEDFSEDLDENPLVTLGLPTETIVAAVNRAFPPDWVQSRVEEVFNGFGRYISGQQDGFEVSPRLREQALITVAELKALLRDADAYNLMFEELIDPGIEDALTYQLPLDVEISAVQLQTAVRNIAPPEWIKGQFEAALDEITPYLIGQQQTFEIKVPLQDRANIALVEIKSLLRESDAYDLLYTQVIEPFVLDSIGPSVSLPFGLAIAGDEVLDGLRRVAPPEWVSQQAEAVIDQASAYLTGAEDGFAINISLADNKREAATVLEETIDVKLAELVGNLSTCDLSSTGAAATSIGRGQIPSCIPPGIDAQQALDRLDIDVKGFVRRFVLDPIPNDMTFTDVDLRRALVVAGAAENLDLIDDIREIVRDGWVYSDVDLRADLERTWGDQALERLQDVREFLADEWSYTEIDFRNDLVTATSIDSLNDFDNGRDLFGTVRTFRFIVYLPIIIVVVLIGFLGGATWRQRFGWAAVYLLITSFLVFLAAGLVYGEVSDVWLDEVRDGLTLEFGMDGKFENTERLVRDKLLEIVDSVSDGFASGIAKRSLIFVAVAAAILAIALGWDHILKLYRRIRKERPITGT